jgi:pimeloyl-ACP methyl ester carboxylesterase
MVNNFLIHGLPVKCAVGHIGAVVKSYHSHCGEAVAKTPSAASGLQQEVHFCTAADGVRIAYAAVGQGPPLIKAGNWLNHLEYDWQSPVWSVLLHALAADYRLIRYDARGNGLSDWEVEDLSFEAFVRDLESVIEASGLDRFPLLGVSQGCAVCIAYAVRHPERVSRLVLYVLSGDRGAARRKDMPDGSRQGRRSGHHSPADRDDDASCACRASS